jgi:hypothetical protein
MIIIYKSRLIEKRFDEALGMLKFQALHYMEYRIRKKYTYFLEYHVLSRQNLPVYIALTVVLCTVNYLLKNHPKDSIYYLL